MQPNYLTISLAVHQLSKEKDSIRWLTPGVEIKTYVSHDMVKDKLQVTALKIDSLPEADAMG